MSLLDVLSGDNDQDEKMFGVYLGIVTNNMDPENLARVKVRFPWRESQDESTWARIATTMAGNGRGTYFLPEVNDEVLVAFEHGDINYPFIIGFLWNGKNKPPAENDGENNIRKIKSRSGHEIILDDTSGQEKIEVKDKSGNNMIVIDSSRNSILIESGSKLKIKAQNIEIEADAGLTIKSSAGIEVNASANLVLKGAMVQIN